MQHNDLRDLTANMMSKVCKDTETEPKLTPLSGEELQGRTANNSNEESVDIRNRGFWERGQQAFFDLRVYLFIYLFIYVFIYLFICLFIYFMLVFT